MISKLFKRLAELPGINWFNHKEKIERELPVGRINPKGYRDDPELLLKLSMKYFEKIVVQDKYIFIQKKLIDAFDAEVQRWDDIQANHESDVEKRTAELQRDLNAALNRVAHLEAKLEKAQLTRRPKIIISSRDADKLLKHLDLVSLRMTGYSRDKEARKYREMHQTLHNFLQKLKAHADHADTV